MHVAKTNTVAVIQCPENFTKGIEQAPLPNRAKHHLRCIPIHSTARLLKYTGIRKELHQMYVHTCGIVATFWYA